MASTNPQKTLAPEVKSALDLIQMLQAKHGNPELLKQIIDILGVDNNSLEDFLEQLLNKLNELIPSELLFIGLVTESEGRLRVVVRDRSRHIIGALKGKVENPLSDFVIGGEELPEKDRSLTGYVAFTKQPMIIKDVRQWKQERGFYRSTYSPIRSEIAVPILFEDRDVIGVINLESRHQDYYSVEHLHQLQWIARLISRSLDSLMNRAGYHKPSLSVLDKIGHHLQGLRINADLSPQARKYLSEDSSEVFSSVANNISKALNSQSCQIWILTRNQDEMTLESEIGSDQAKVTVKTASDALATQAMEQRCLLRCGPWDDSSAEPMLIAPMLASGKKYGAIKVTSRNSGPHGQKDYTLGDERMLSVLQHLIATQIHLKRLEWDRRAAALRRRRDVAALINIFGNIDLDTVLENGREKIMDLCEASQCSIFILDEFSQEYVRTVSSKLPEGFINRLSYKPGQGLTGWVAKYGLPLNIRGRRDRDLAHISPPIEWDNKEKQQHPDLIDRPFIAVPILLQGQTVGVIRCTDKYGEHPIFTESDEHILSLIASFISATIAFTKRYEGALKLLNNIKQILAIIRNIDETPKVGSFESQLFNQILEAARNIFAADVAVIYRCRNEQVELPPIKVGKLDYEEYFGDPLDKDSVVFKIANGTDGPRYFTKTEDEPLLTQGRADGTRHEARGRFVVRENIVSSVGIKIQARCLTRGVLFLNYKGKPHTFNPDFRELVKDFTDLISLCIEISELYKGSMEIAEDLHKDIIPTLMRDVVADADFGRKHLRDDDYEKTRDCLYGIGDASQGIVMSLSGIVGRLITNFTKLDSLIPAD